VEVTACRGCGTYLMTEAQLEHCAVDGCPMCHECWETWGYAPHHSDQEINATSLLGPMARRFPETVRRAARERIDKAKGR
jgi:hypothetical protein